MLKTIHRRWLPLALSLCGIAGCGGPKSSDTTAPGTASPGATTASSDLTTVRVGYLPNIVLPQPLLGIQNKEYEKQVPGVTFVGKDYPAGPAVMEALRAGQVDIAYTGPYPPIKAFGKAKDVILLAGAAKGGTGLMVAKNSPYKSIKDLKGKIIGVNQAGSTVDAMVRFNVIQAGMVPDKDVQIKEVPPAQQADALSRGEAAAVAAPAPWPSQVALKGNGRPLLDSKQILANGDYLSGVCFTTKKFADAHPDLVKKFVAAHRAITGRLNKDRAKGDAEVLAAWSKVTHKTLSPAIAKAAFSTIEFTNDADLKTLERDAGIAYQVGILKEQADLTGFVYSP